MFILASVPGTWETAEKLRLRD